MDLCGAKDATEFLNWQKAVLQEDKDRELKATEHRRMLGKLSHEEAILARQNQMEENKETVSKLKVESAKMMQKYLVLRLEEEKQMRKLVEQIIEGHHNAQDARLKLKEYKQKIVQEVNAESREMMRRALEEAEMEMKRKTELIQEIRAAESVPISRQKLVDLTATAGHALLSEMSITELQERLSLLREAQKAEEDSRRDSIIQSKQEKNEKIMETIARISVHRTELSKAASMRAEKKKQLEQERQDTLRQDSTLQQLKEHLQQKKEERLRRVSEAKLVPTKQSAVKTSSLIREKKQLEKTRWRQLEMSQQRLAEKRALRTPV
uniref:Cilia- and flagella-associated protein 99 n=1 Tax=Ciona savignyi TaxID=51511 RepID=H2ZPE0_CIOSA